MIIIGGTRKENMKFKEKLLYILPISLILSFVLLIFSHYFIGNLVIKFSLMGFAYSIIVSLIDFFTSVVQDTILDKSSREEQQLALTYLSLSYKIFKVIFGFLISLILLEYSLIYVLILLIILILISIVSFINTYKKLSK